MSKQNCLIIFTRKPELGKVKTRLAKGVGDEFALKIYEYLLEHTAKITSQVNAHKQVWYTNEIVKDDIWDDKIFKKHVQIEGDLGEKMRFVFEEAFKSGFVNVLIIGSDLLDIGQDMINDAFEYLNQREVVVGPAKDGGYYLLGMNHFIPEVFEDINWSTSQVFQQTLDRISKKTVAILDEKNDIDFKEDAMEHEELKRLINF